jgi:hypothetical protein
MIIILFIILIFLIIYNKNNEKLINKNNENNEKLINENNEKLINKNNEKLINKNKLSILSQFKNETFNLKIWIEHYIWQGVEHFYLIDNDSTDNPLEILQPYIKNGIVSYYFMPEKYKQEDNYNHIFNKENLKNKTEWIIICDLDEFFYGVDDTLINIIDNYNKYDIIYSNWRMFGSDGLILHPNDIRISILYREPTINNHTKYIFKTDKITKSHRLGIHDIKKLYNSITVNDKIKLNHYPIQSIEFYSKIKMTRGDGTTGKWNNVRDINYFKVYNKNKIIKDDELANKIIDNKLNNLNYKEFLS